LELRDIYYHLVDLREDLEVILHPALVLL
jgi:hypothetical protein